MTPTDATLLVEKLGLPLALVVVLGAACAMLARYVVKLIEAHRLEREAADARHLAALQQLGFQLQPLAAIGEGVRDLKRGQDESARELGRISDRLAARGCASLATLAVFLLLVLLAALGCTTKEKIRAELKASAETQSASTARAELQERSAVQVATVKVAEPVKVVTRTARREIVLDPATGKPARIILERQRRSFQRGKVTLATAQKTDTAKAAQLQAAAAAKAANTAALGITGEKESGGFFSGLWQAFGLWVVLAGVALALAGFLEIAHRIAKAGGIGPAFTLFKAALGRVLGGKSDGV